jgi:hypothetical protein
MPPCVFAGPCYVSYLEQQVQAAILSLDPQKATGAVAASSKPLHIPLSQSLADDGDREGKVATTAEEAAEVTAYGALRAYYAFSVVMCLMNAESKAKHAGLFGGEGAGGETEKAGTEEGQGDVRTNDSEANGHGTEASSTSAQDTSTTNGHSQTLISPQLDLEYHLDSPVATLRMLSQALLWDCELERCKLQDALGFIQQAIGDLITKHGHQKGKLAASKTDEAKSDAETNPPKSGYSQETWRCGETDREQLKNEEIPQPPVKTPPVPLLNIRRQRKGHDNKENTHEFVDMNPATNGQNPNTTTTTAEVEVEVEVEIAQTISTDDVVLEEAGKAETAGDHGKDVARIAERVEVEVHCKDDNKEDEDTEEVGSSLYENLVYTEIVY